MEPWSGAARSLNLSFSFSQESDLLKSSRPRPVGKQLFVASSPPTLSFRVFAPMVEAAHGNEHVLHAVPGVLAKAVGSASHLGERNGVEHSDPDGPGPRR